MTAPQRFARIHRVMVVLRRHPEGLPLDAVAEQIGVSTASLRRDILEYYATDIPPEALMGLARAEAIEFIAADGAEVDPHLAPMIRAVSDRPEAELGVEYLRADQLVELYEAGRSLSLVEPDNEILARAVGTLADTFLEQRTGAGSVRAHPEIPAVLRRGLELRRVVSITYSRAWRPGVGVRDIHPYQLLATQRGWEVDAGPLVEGHARTFIVDRITSAELREESFERPEAIASLLQRERAAATVEFSLPQRTHWVVDRFAEAVTVVESDASDLLVRAELLPPVAERVGMILLIAGPDAFVVNPSAHSDAGTALARSLLAHHGLSGNEPVGPDAGVTTDA